MLNGLVNAQSAMKGELLVAVKKVDVKVDSLDDKVKKLDTKIDDVEKRLTRRLNGLGKTLAVLDEDAPTGEDFTKLEKRVQKIERKIAFA